MVDFTFQTDKWGNVEWHHDIELHDTAARVAAANVFFQCHTNDTLIKSKTTHGSK